MTNSEKTLNYEKHYLKLFQKAKNRLANFEGELHHFIPSTFTKNIRHKNKIKLLENLLDITFENSIKLLTYREHFIAHLLLFKIFKCESSMFALSFVMNRLKFAKNYDNFKKLVINSIKNKWKGKVSLFDKETQSNVIINYIDYEKNKNRYQGLNINSNCNSKQFECEFCNKIIFGHSNYSQHKKHYCNENKDVIIRPIKNKSCKFCHQDVVQIRIKDHERSCELNPNRTKRKNKNFEISNCRFCKLPFKNAKIHENNCKLNPEKTIYKKVYINCQFCNKQIIDRGLKIHENHCSKNLNKNIEKTNCKFCQKEFNAIAIHLHERCCNLNLNKIVKKRIVKKTNCKFCQKEIGINNIIDHERACKLNPNKTKRNNK